MYGYQAIKDFRKFVAEAPKGLAIQNMEILMNNIGKAQHYHMGSDKILNMVHKVRMKESKKNIDQEAFMGQYAIDVKLPYDKCWFDFIDKETYYGANGKPTDVKFGIFASNTDPAGTEFSADVIQFMPCFCSYEAGISRYATNGKFPYRKKWLLCGDSYFIKIGSHFTEKEASLIFEGLVNDLPTSEEDKRLSLTSLTKSHTKGNLLTFPTIDLGEGWESSEKFLVDFGHALGRRAVVVLNIFLMVLNCKNVITEVVEATRKDGKSKKPNKKIFRYKILKFKLPKSRKKYINSDKTGRVVPLHLCGGHYKTYTEDAPLFGKIVGRWWWDSHTRGSDEIGMVAKDYEADIKVS